MWIIIYIYKNFPQQNSFADVGCLCWGQGKPVSSGVAALRGHLISVAAGCWPLCLAPQALQLARLAPWCQSSHELLTSWPHDPLLSQVGLCVPTCSLSRISLAEDLTCLEMPALGTCLPEPRIRKTWASYLFFHSPSGPLLPPPATSPH